jgi:xanthine dehydrogenase YagS FAD-binding subunit
MMKNFAYVKAGSLAEATRMLSVKGARLLAGGTDLLGCLRDEVFQADKVVSVGKVKEMQGISSRPDGGLKIGALTTIADIAVNPAIAGKYPALAQAAAEVGSPQIREQGTIGGNICQRPRCWYFRGDFRCLKKGGTKCYAVGGENQYHAIFGGGPCFAVHPSDTAVALQALGARILIAGGTQAIGIENFFVAPNKKIAGENILAPGQIVTGIHLPAVSGTVRSSYRKVRARGAWDFALASVALVLQFDGDVVRSGHIVLGGVAPYPWRAEAAEKLLAGKKPDASLASAVADAAAAGARPLRDNAYKVEIVKGAVLESIMALL